MTGVDLNAHCRGPAPPTDPELELVPPPDVLAMWVASCAGVGAGARTVILCNPLDGIAAAVTRLS